LFINSLSRKIALQLLLLLVISCKMLTTFLNNNLIRRLNIYKIKIMEKLGLLARLEAKAGKEAEVEAFLKSALSIVNEEEETVKWYALKFGPSSFGIFDTFEAESGRDAHLNGKVAAALMAGAEELLSVAPTIEKIEFLAVK
jgi:quinol monooxygenase YgiN